MRLNEILLNKTYYIKSLCATGVLKARMYDLGIVEGTEIKGMFKAPFGEPTAYMVRGTLLALRDEDAKLIEVKTVRDDG